LELPEDYSADEGLKLFMIHTQQSFFTKQLLHWNKKKNKRMMPWKGEKDPYKIWLSEIILQQTRVEQGWVYYERFIEKFPVIQDLANANMDVVFKLWEGLGYYSRCRNLILTAKIIVDQFDGTFPTSYDDILKLKGVGPYTAAAIASFAYNLPYAVVDGNVIRVLARFFGENKPVDDTTVKKKLQLLAQQLVDKNQPGIYNQAIMDFGATICKPSIPICDTCILQKKCEAYMQKKVGLWPIKSKKIKKSNRFFAYFIIHWKNTICVMERSKKDIWQNLHEFYLYETNEKENWTTESIQQILITQLRINDFYIDAVTPWYKQVLSHQIIHAAFIEITYNRKPKISVSHKWIDKKIVRQLAFPKIINSYLQQST